MLKFSHVIHTETWRTALATHLEFFAVKALIINFKKIGIQESTLLSIAQHKYSNKVVSFPS